VEMSKTPQSSVGNAVVTLSLAALLHTVLSEVLHMMCQKEQNGTWSKNAHLPCVPTILS